MTPRVNYDAVAPTYNRRAAGGGYLQDITVAVQKLARRVNARRVLDLGCGTGRSLIGLADFGDGFGLDFSAGMLAQARVLNGEFRLVQASAPTPPFAGASFDLVISVLAFHHFPLQAQVVGQAYRLLKPGGAFAIANFDPHAGDNRWFVYDYFPETIPLDRDRFPAMSWYESELRAAGFCQISSPVVEHVQDPIIGEAILNSYWLQKDSCSQFILLSDSDYRAGRQRIEAAVWQARAAGQTVVFETDLSFRLFHGFKPLTE